jgi:adenylate cyclase
MSCLLGVAAWTGSAILLFDQNFALPLLIPLGAGLASFVLVLGLRFVFLDRDRRFLRKAFASYVAPALVDQLVENPDQLKLRGERREMTFLFTDLAGFTSLIEQQDPEEAVSLLNVYLDKMAKIAKRHGGTIDKVVGDALHIIFSAPVSQSDHADRAVDCALEMDAFATRFATEKQAEGIPFGHTRIGVNSGTAIIGNFGGDEYFDYTAHGDAINTAARLESVNKQLGTRIAVSGETVRRCSSFSGRPIGNLILKGKTKPTEVYEPICNKTEQLKLFAKYASAYDLMEREEAEAADAFSALAKEFPDDGLTRFHLSRLNSGQTGATIHMKDK